MKVFLYYLSSCLLVLFSSVFIKKPTHSINKSAPDSWYLSLSRKSDSLSKDNQIRAKKTVKKVMVLDSSNKVIAKKLDITKKELKETKADLFQTEKQLQQKPKEVVIEKVVEKPIYIEKKKNFWGTEKIDTIKN